LQVQIQPAKRILWWSKQEKNLMNLTLLTQGTNFFKTKTISSTFKTRTEYFFWVVRKETKHNKLNKIPQHNIINNAVIIGSAMMILYVKLPLIFYIKLTQDQLFTTFKSNSLYLLLPLIKCFHPLFNLSSCSTSNLEAQTSN
jgi:hypothetical protein